MRNLMASCRQVQLDKKHATSWGRDRVSAAKRIGSDIEKFLREGGTIKVLSSFGSAETGASGNGLLFRKKAERRNEECIS
jgi:hypothetical protein